MYESLVGKCYKAKYYGYREYIKIKYVYPEDNMIDAIVLYDDFDSGGWDNVTFQIAYMKDNGDIKLYYSNDDRSSGEYVEVSRGEFDDMRQGLCDYIYNL